MGFSTWCQVLAHIHYAYVVGICVVSIGGVFNFLGCIIICVSEMNDIRKLSCKFCLIQNLARTHEGYKHHHYSHQILNMTRRTQDGLAPHKKFIILYVSLLKS